MRVKNVKKFIVVDGYGFIFRAYYAMPTLFDSRGRNVGAIYGFINMLLKIITTSNYEYLVIALDTGGKTFRHDIDKEYKANRTSPDVDLIEQLKILDSVIKAFNVYLIKIERYEADDIIASFAKWIEESTDEIELEIISSDKDLYQLISNKVLLFDHFKNRIFDKEAVNDKLGIYPDKVIDYLALTGDSADNIKGIPGVGPKNAIKLLEEFGSFVDIIGNGERIKSAKIREYVVSNGNKLLTNLDLVKLKDDLPITKDLEIYKKNKPDLEYLLNILGGFDFKTIVTRCKTLFTEKDLNGNDLSVTKNDHPMIGGSYLMDFIHMDEKFCHARDNLMLYVKNKIYYFLNDSRNCYIDFYHQCADDSKNAKSHRGLMIICTDDHQILLVHNNCCALALRLLMSDKLIKKVFFDLHSILTNIHLYTNDHSEKMDLFLDIGTIHNIDDLKTMCYSLHSTKYKIDLNSLCSIYKMDHQNAMNTLRMQSNDCKDWPFSPLINGQENDTDNTDQCLEAIAFALQIKDLFNLMYDAIICNKILYLYKGLDLQMILSTHIMHTIGIKFDHKIVEELLSDYQNLTLQRESEIYQISGREFDIGSTKQLSQVCQSLGMNLIKKGKSGSFTMDVQILENFADQGFDIARKIIEWRHYTKMINTYLSPLIKIMHNNTGKLTNRVHSIFLLTEIATGRISSRNPNLQNIPIKNEESYKIRRAFVAENGKKFVIADYSQIELRILAHMAKVPKLCEAIIAGVDVHNVTASEIFNVDIIDITPSMRMHAKTINFGIIYGMTAFGLAKKLRISRKIAEQYIEQYFIKYPEIIVYMNQMTEIARNSGYVNTIFGRKCFVGMKYYGNIHRPAVNAPIQGSGADIIRRAMNKICRIFNQNCVNANIVLQVHDELIIEAKEEDVDKVKDIIRNSMINAARLIVPLEIKMEVSDNWYLTHN